MKKKKNKERIAVHLCDVSNMIFLRRSVAAINLAVV